MSKTLKNQAPLKQKQNSPLFLKLINVDKAFPLMF